MDNANHMQEEQKDIPGDKLYAIEKLDQRVCTSHFEAERIRS
jgi:hypothetical protein